MMEKFTSWDIFTAYVPIARAECLSKNAGSQFVPIIQIHDSQFSKCEMTQPALSLHWKNLPLDVDC
jgi:hypothetical protein